MSHETNRTLSVEDESVRAIRNRLWATRTRLEAAMSYVMYPEVREELRQAHAHLTDAFSYIGG
jgi:uncharacterized protein (DUF2461 family)